METVSGSGPHPPTPSPYPRERGSRYPSPPLPRVGRGGWGVRASSADYPINSSKTIKPRLPVTSRGPWHECHVYHPAVAPRRRWGAGPTAHPLWRSHAPTVDVDFSPRPVAAPPDPGPGRDAERCRAPGSCERVATRRGESYTPGLAAPLGWAARRGRLRARAASSVHVWCGSACSRLTLGQRRPDQEA